jgi:hypothetical protein
MDSHVLRLLQEYESFTGGSLTVSGNQVRYTSRDGFLYIDFDKSIADIMRGASSQANVRIRINP